MLSSSTDNADNKATRAADGKEDNDSTENVSAKQLALQIEQNLSIEKKESVVMSSTTDNADNKKYLPHAGRRGKMII